MSEMKVGDVDISQMSVNEAVRFFTGTYHEQVKAIVISNKAQLLIAMETRSIREKIKPILDHFNIIEREVLEHINQEGEILRTYLHDKNLSFELAGINMYTIVKEHDSVLKLLEELGHVCNNYVSKNSDHVMLKLCYAKLNNFEQDLRRYIYFENNVFFPKVLKTGLKSTKH